MFGPWTPRCPTIERIGNPRGSVSRGSLRNPHAWWSFPWLSRIDAENQDVPEAVVFAARPSGGSPEKSHAGQFARLAGNRLTPTAAKAPRNARNHRPSESPSGCGIRSDGRWGVHCVPPVRVVDNRFRPDTTTVTRVVKRPAASTASKRPPIMRRATSGPLKKWRPSPVAAVKYPRTWASDTAIGFFNSRLGLGRFQSGGLSNGTCFLGFVLQFDRSGFAAVVRRVRGSRLVPSEDCDRSGQRP